MSLVGDVALQVVVAMMEPLQEGGQVASSAVKVVEAALLEAQDIVQDHLLGVPPLPLEIDALGRFCCQCWRSANSLVCEQAVLHLHMVHSDSGCCAKKVLCSCV